PMPEERSTTTVTAQRRTPDELITEDVVKAIQAEPNISGNVGVETYQRVVTLTGRVTSQGQVDRVGRAAMKVVDRDVEVRNLVRSKLEI
ncbi:MAG TPA: BON domain-containing protein, partial [Usitatibacter sp.]|nr:BON domain-containing protein [Usitatibacter sp.]